MSLYAPFSRYSFLMSAAAVVALLAAGAAWRRRAAPGAAFLALTELMVAIWAVGAASEAAALTPELKLAWVTLVHLGGTLSPVFFLGFALGLRRNSRLLTPTTVTLACLIPIITIGLVMTNFQHHLMWSQITLVGPGNSAEYTPGPWFWVFVTYTYGCVTLAAILFWEWVIRARSYAPWQILLFIIATVAPTAASIVYITGVGPTAGMDLTPAGFMITGLALVLGIRYLSLFDLVPVARHKVLDTMVDGVLVLDAQHRVVDLNAAMTRLVPGPSVIGSTLEIVLAGSHDLLATISDATEGRVEIMWQVKGEPRDFDVRTTPLLDAHQKVSGWLLVFRDVTERKALQVERERLISELEQALGQVKTLSGLLPICASCKRIRDEANEWHHVENYVADHSQADFTHGICPECMAKYLAELEQ